MLERVVRSINSAYIDSCTMGEWWIGQDIPCLSTKLDVSKFRPIDIFLCWQRRKRLQHFRENVKRETWSNRIEKRRKMGFAYLIESISGICIRLFRVASPDKCSHLEAKCLNGNFNLIVCWSFVFTVSHFRLRFISNLHLPPSRDWEHADLFRFRSIRSNEIGIEFRKRNS